MVNFNFPKVGGGGQNRLGGGEIAPLPLWSLRPWPFGKSTNQKLSGIYCIILLVLDEVAQKWCKARSCPSLSKIILLTYNRHTRHKIQSGKHNSSIIFNIYNVSIIRIYSTLFNCCRMFNQLAYQASLKVPWLILCKMNTQKQKIFIDIFMLARLF